MWEQRISLLPLWSALIFEFQVVHGNQIAVLDAHGLQPVEEAGFPEHLVEPQTAFVIAEVGVGDEPLEPGTLHQV